MRAAFITMILAAGSAGLAGAIDPASTFSIVALDPTTGEIGVAVQSRAFSVGSAVPWVEAGVGAIATQSQTNESFGPQGLALLREGLSAPETMKALLANDPGRDRRCAGRQRIVHGREVLLLGRRLESRGSRRPGEHPRRTRGRRRDGPCVSIDARRTRGPSLGGSRGGTGRRR